jgi:plasmid stabilization system protein ParE
MDVELILAPEAELDLLEAYAWYEKQRFGLGEDFLCCVDARIQSILRMPTMFEIVHKNYRRALVRRFPYAVFYEHADGKVTVYCVFHTARDASKWRQRLP